MDLRTERLLLRRWSPDDAADVAAAYDIYRRLEVARWLGARPSPWASPDAARERLARWARIAGEQPGFGTWAIVPDSVGRPVGTVLLVHLPDADGEPTSDVEIGWHLHPDHWGCGYATEAATTVLAHAFGHLGLGTVNAVAYPENSASFAVMRRIGLSRRGVTDRWYATNLEWWSAEAPSA